MFAVGAAGAPGAGGRGAAIRWTGAASAGPGPVVVSVGRVIGAPMGDLRGAELVRGAGASVVERCTGAPSPGRAGGVTAAWLGPGRADGFAGGVTAVGRAGATGGA